MRLSKEALSWIITVIVGVLTALVAIKGSTALAFGVPDLAPLVFAAFNEGVADYEADAADL